MHIIYSVVKLIQKQIPLPQIELQSCCSMCPLWKELVQAIGKYSNGILSALQCPT